MRENLFEKLKDFVCENNDWVKREEIKLESDLREFGIDSIQMMMMIVFIEEEFGVTMEEDVMDKGIFTTFESVMDYVEKIEKENA